MNKLINQYKIKENYFGKSKLTILEITSHTTIVQMFAAIARSTAEISGGGGGGAKLAPPPPGYAVSK